MSRALMVAMALMLMGGCAQYRRDLAEWERNERTPFVSDTLAWLDREPAAAEPSAADAVAGEWRATLDTMKQEAGSLDEAGARVAGAVIGAPAAESLESLHDPSAREAAFTRGPSWPDVASAVALDNRDVAAAGERWLAALSQFTQAEFLETLVAQYRVFAREIDTGAGEQRQRAMTREFFPFPGVVSLRGEMVRSQVRMAELEWSMALREALADAAEAWVDARFAAEAADAASENLGLLEGLLGVIEDRYTAGRAEQAELLQMQTERARLRNELDDFASQRRAAVARLNALAGRPAGAPVGPLRGSIPSQGLMGTEQWTEVALERRQEVGIAEARADELALAVQMAEAMNRPAAGRGTALFERGMMADAPPRGDMTDSMSAGDPVFGERAAEAEPGYGAAEAYLGEMRRRAAAAELELEGERLDTGALVRERLEQLDQARRRLTLVREIVRPQDMSAYESMRAAYEGGRSGFAELVETERRIVGSRLEEVEARRMLAMAEIALARVTGSMAGE